MAPVCVKVYLELCIFLIFPREFESVETSPGFAWQVSALRTYLQFFCEYAIFSSKLSSFNNFFPEIMNLLTILLKKIDNVKKNPVNLQCATHKH